MRQILPIIAGFAAVLAVFYWLLSLLFQGAVFSLILHAYEVIT